VDALSRVPRIADCDAGVLILGETGTGKDLFAQAVHYLSPRAGGPCVAVNCGALPADLVEAELFGHARGAFTSAHETRMGLVGQAEGGTLFLDEVDSLPPMAQVKLLRFLQDKEYRPVGAAKAQRADVRIVAACNVDLAGLCERSAFRTDLYYRLNILALHLPALRDRGADVLALAAHFAAGFARRFRRPVYDFAPAARARLLAHAWPGNVRELEHAIERAVLLADGDAIEAGDLGLPPAQEGAPADGGVSVGSPGLESFSAAKARAVAQFERRYIEDALAHCAGNITHAADAVAKNRRAFFELMRKHRIDSAAYREAAARAADESP
jgi:two-component system response regulator GlrR